MTLTDLVVLQFSSNPCYVEVVSPKKVKGLTVSKTSYSFGNYKNIPIGKAIHTDSVIGVYNRNKISHLDSMVRTATETVHVYHSRLDD
ncbi:MAG: hypothetical protein ABIH63_03555 [archaeon]